MNHLLFIGVGQIVIIALVVLLLFGGTKIPELMKGLGKGYKIFKKNVPEAGSGCRDRFSGRTQHGSG